MSQTAFYPLMVKKLHRSTDDALTITLALPDTLWSVFDYQAGQFLTVKVMIEGETYRRAYSLNSSPAIDEPLEITVKRLKGGRVSNFLHDTLKEGDVLEMMPPQGQFTDTIIESNYRSYYLFAAGSGITPILSILKTILVTELHSTVVLFYGSRDEQSIVLREAIAEWEAKYPERLNVVHTLSRPISKTWSALWTKVENWQGRVGRVGRIDEKSVTWCLNTYKPVAQIARYFICGPAAMIDSTEKALLALNVHRPHIHIERFGGDDSEQSSVYGCEAKLVVKLGEQESQHKISAGRTVLQALKADGLSVPYSCESGVCGSCRAYLIKGQVAMKNNMALTEQEVKAGDILCCQAVPQSETISIEFDK